MGKVIQLADKLMNAITGAGTGRDARFANAYASRPLTQYEIAAAYSGSGLMRKIAQIPALDMVREWRDWSGLKDDQAAAVWDEEKRLHLREKARQAEVLRALGGGALILGLPGDPNQPAPTKISKGQLAFVHVVSRWHLTFEQLQDDATQDGMGEPAMWQLRVAGGQQAIHPSRVIPFRADHTASLAMPSTWSSADAFWGESTVHQVIEAVKDCDAAHAAFAALAHKARLLRLGIPGLMDITASEGGEAFVQKRLAAVAAAESLHNATIYDSGNEKGEGGEEIKDATYSFAGAKDMLDAYNQRVSAIADIPMTRMHGRAAEGMNSSGDSQQRDWNKKIRAMQTLQLGPCMERVDPLLLQSAGVADAASASYDWAPLDTPSEKEKADRFWLESQAIEKVGGLAAMPEPAFNRGVQSWMVENGYLPELEAALRELPDEERYGIEPDPTADPAELGLPGEQTGEPGQLAAANDAAPRSLYVQRKLLNAAELIAWAKGQGFKTTLPASDMHVTVLFSRSPVDWMKMGSNWSGDAKGNLTVPPGGARLVEPLGDKGAVVLLFASSELSWRHDDMVRSGASHDFEDYQPHVTITFQKQEGLDLAKVEPFRGELRFGPEIFQELDDDWRAGVTEYATDKRVVRDAAPAPVLNITVPVEVHLPKSGATRTVVTKHTEDGRIAEFEKHEIKEE